MATTKQRILIVDDHPVVHLSLSRLIGDEQDVEICGTAVDVATAKEQASEKQPDMILLDLSLRDSHGMELITWARENCPAVKVLVWSASDESLFAERAYRGGARGYISKCEPPGKLMDAIREVLRGGIYLPPGIRRRLLCRLSEGGEPSQDPIASLSNRELAVFRMLGQGMTTQHIALCMDLSHKTIETYREKIKKKLGLANGAELMSRAVQFVMENG